MALRGPGAALSILFSIGCGPSVSTLVGGEGTDSEQGDTAIGGSESTSAHGTSADDESSGVLEPPWVWSEDCIDGLDGPPVDATQASEILFRLLDEGRHHVERVQLLAAMMDGTGTEALDYEETNGDGVLTAEGSVSVEPFGAVSSDHVAELVCYTGGHGGFGPVALDGRVDVSVGGVTNTMDDYTLTISGVVRLGGGGAFSPTSPADVVVDLAVIGGREVVSGTIAGHDASAL